PQAPSSQHQRSSKSQTPRQGVVPCADSLKFGVWNFFGAWSLELGAGPAPPRSKRFARHGGCVIQFAAPMQPSNEQLEQDPLRREKLLEYLPWLEHTLGPRLNRAAPPAGFHKFRRRRTSGGVRS